MEGFIFRNNYFRKTNAEIQANWKNRNLEKSKQSNRLKNKSVVDGIGGSVKRYVRNKIISQDLIVSNSSDFANVAKTMNIEVKLVNTPDILSLNETILLKQIIKTSKQIKDIKKFHSFEVQRKIKGKTTVDIVVGSKISSEL